MIKGHKIEKKVKTKEFLEKIKEFNKTQIFCTKHTFFRLSEKQRQLFTCEHIKELIITNIPYLIGIQYNNCYTVFYKYKKKKYIRIILDISYERIEVVTFYMIEREQLLNIK